MTCQCEFISDDKCTTLVGDVDSGGARFFISVHLFKMLPLLLNAVKYLCIFPTVFFLPQGKIALKNAANYFVYYIQGY